MRELLSKGFKVRAGVRSTAKARGFLETAVSYGLLPADAARRVQLVEVDLTNADEIPGAIGSAGRVSCSTLT